jgi:hypothetical protein
MMHAAGISGAGKDRDQRFRRAQGIETNGQGVGDRDQRFFRVVRGPGDRDQRSGGGDLDDKNQPRYRAVGHTEHTLQHFACIENTSARSTRTFIHFSCKHSVNS